jgi:hypothetical protein
MLRCSVTRLGRLHQKVSWCGSKTTTMTEIITATIAITTASGVAIITIAGGIKY